VYEIEWLDIIIYHLRWLHNMWRTSIQISLLTWRIAFHASLLLFKVCITTLNSVQFHLLETKMWPWLLANFFFTKVSGKLWNQTNPPDWICKNLFVHAFGSVKYKFTIEQYVTVQERTRQSLKYWTIVWCSVEKRLFWYFGQLCVENKKLSCDSVGSKNFSFCRVSWSPFCPVV
jgi:hypothetical protein